ncbi:MAG: hypothetical protein L0215_23840 [Gemmataceae bacterium]|nr:hypothetical protein [Gemmataceae bacterium]
MKAEGNGQPQRFEVDMSGVVKRQIKQVMKRARKAGKFEPALAALKKVIARLHADPWNLGERFKDFKHLKLVGHVAVVWPLAVHFAIHETRPIAYIMKVVLL